MRGVQLGLEVLEVERHVVQADVHLAHGQPAIGGHRLPGADVRLVVQRRDDDLVAGCQGRADGSADVQGQGRHVVAELDLVRRGRAEEVGDGRVGLVGDRVTQLAGREGATGVGVRILVVAHDGIDDALRDLRAARSVEEGDGTSSLLAGERGELGAQGFDIERGHGSSRDGWAPSVP